MATFLVLHFSFYYELLDFVYQYVLTINISRYVQLKCEVISCFMTSSIETYGTLFLLLCIAGYFYCKIAIHFKAFSTKIWRHQLENDVIGGDLPRRTSWDREDRKCNVRIWGDPSPPLWSSSLDVPNSSENLIMKKTSFKSDSSKKLDRFTEENNWIHFYCPYDYVCGMKKSLLKTVFLLFHKYRSLIFFFFKLLLNN